MENPLEIRGNGKLLLTAEYTILSGAQGLAVPTKLGQNFTFEKSSEKGLHWQSLQPDSQPWFEALFSPKGEILETTSQDIAQNLKKLIAAASENSPLFGGYRATAHLEFDRHWGLGSSSTLIFALARFHGMEPLALFIKTQNGSGYDVVCAGSDQPILYKLENRIPVFSESKFHPAEAENWWLVYLGKKQNSTREVQKFKSGNTDPGIITEISLCTKELLRAQNLLSAREIFELHEAATAKALGRETIKKERFRKFDGTIKSLGAWGGDFVLALHPDPEYVKFYFSKIGLSPVLAYTEMVLI